MGAEDRRHFVGSIRRRLCLLDIALHPAEQHPVCGERRDRPRRPQIASAAHASHVWAESPMTGSNQRKATAHASGNNAKIAPGSQSLR
jgi:hypothetical protein